MRISNFLLYFQLFLITAIIVCCCDPVIAKTFTPYFTDTKLLAECVIPDLCYKRVTLTQVGAYTVQMFEHQWLGDVQNIESEADAVILDTFNHTIAERNIGGWTVRVKTDADSTKRSSSGRSSMVKWYRPNWLSLVDTSEDFPFLLFLSSTSSTSNVTHTYIFYTTNPSLRKIAEISGLITEYQATGTGTALKVTGFYRSQNGEILFDRLTTEGQEFGESNASQKHSLETFKVTPSGVVSIRLKDFNYLEYREQYRSMPVDGKSF
jgi:hypothetical protein